MDVKIKKMAEYKLEIILTDDERDILLHALECWHDQGVCNEKEGAKELARELWIKLNSTR